MKNKTKTPLADRCREYAGRHTYYTYADVLWRLGRQRVNRKTWKRQTMNAREYYRIMDSED